MIGRRTMGTEVMEQFEALLSNMTSFLTIPENSRIGGKGIWFGQLMGKSVGKNRFEHNNLAIFELKLHWVPQSFFGGSTWECVLLHEEMEIIY